MFNSSGLCFLEKQIEILFTDSKEYNEYKLKIKNIAYLFYLYQQKIKEKPKSKKRDTIYINQIDNNTDNGFAFNSVETDLYTFKQEDGRYQFVFDGKPADEVRTILKSNGFKWSPSRGAWVRQATANARYSVKRVMQELQAYI